MMQTTDEPARTQPAALGYRHGLNQPCLVFDLHLRAPVSVPWGELDGWLQRVFLLEVEASGRPQPSPDAPAQVQALSQRLLPLTGLLLQTGRVPAFEPGRVLSIRPSSHKPDQFILHLAVPCAGWMLRAATIQAHQQVATLLLDWCDGKIRTLAADTVCERLDAVMIQPLAAMGSGGKSTIHLLRAAHALDMPLCHLGGGQYQIGWGARARRVLSSSVDTDSAIGARVAQNKKSAASLLALAGLPAPEHLSASTEAQALQAARRLGWPLVVKPVDRDRGEGVTVDIRDEPTLLQAFKRARALSRQVLVERMVAGFCHRILVVKGRMLYCGQRLPKSVVGDAQRSVAELVAAGNAAEQAKLWWDRLKPFPDDALATGQLAQQGMGWDSVPAQGARVLLRPLQTDLWGGDVEDLTAQIHPENVELALRAARLFALDVVGIDLITADISQPWHRSGAVVNELNPSPLMGGSPLFRRTIPLYFSQLMPAGCRIPVRVIVGDASVWGQAQAWQAEAQARRVRCCVSSHQQTLGPKGQSLALRGATLLERAQGLLLDPAVDELVLLVMTDEILHLGLPVDAIDRVIVQGRALLDHRQPSLVVPEAAVQRLIQILEQAVRPAFKAIA